MFSLVFELIRTSGKQKRKKINFSLMDLSALPLVKVLSFFLPQAVAIPTFPYAGWRRPPSSPPALSGDRSAGFRAFSAAGRLSLADGYL